MSNREELKTLKDWWGGKTVLEVYALSLSEWPMWRRVRIDSLKEAPPVLHLVEESSNLELPPLNLEGAELTRASAGDGRWPFEGVPATAFKCAVFMKLKDGKHIVLTEPQ